MQDAGKRLRQQTAKETGRDDLDSDEILDLAVSFDGTWSKRGHTANFGIGVLMSVDNGEVFVVLSKICEICKQNKATLSTEEFKTWREQHKADFECQQNYEGSSPAMDTHAADVIWKRSVKNIN